MRQGDRKLYRSSTNFDRDLVLDIDEEHIWRDVHCKYTGFKSVEQAKEFATWWVEVQGWGYSPSATAVEENGVISVKTKRWDSCD